MSAPLDPTITVEVALSRASIIFHSFFLLIEQNSRRKPTILLKEITQLVGSACQFSLSV
jgi:hypothetical protein